MKLVALAAVAMAAGVLIGGAASATTVDFSYDSSGVAVATGSFTYATGLTGVLSYTDLTTFDVDVAGVDYTLADVLPLTDYVQFAYDTSSDTFGVNPNACGFDGCGFEESLGAINSSGSYGFFFTGADEGLYEEYSTGAGGSFDSIVITSIAVPEPAAWALMLTGFGGLGAALRVSKRASSRAAAAQSI